jgi:hypothetical protein
MRAPPPVTQPITADQLREIIAGCGRRDVPPDQCGQYNAHMWDWYSWELTALAVESTKLQRCNDPPSSWWENPGDFTLRVDDGPARPQTPVHLQAAYARGQATPPWARRKRDWRDVAPDIAAAFRRLFPGETFGNRDGCVACFVAKVLELIFPADPHPSVGAVGQYLARRSRKTRARR